MSGIAGIMHAGMHANVNRMLAKIKHRGQQGNILETESATLGIVWTDPQSPMPGYLKNMSMAWDDSGEAHFALADGNKATLKRDPLGIAPLYYGWTPDHWLCFASEVKGLLEITRDVHELPAGHTFDGKNLEAYFQLRAMPELDWSPDRLVKELRNRLENAAERHATSGNVGAWLSGGLDSSVWAALARRFSNQFHTFTAGFADSPDVKFAQVVADFIHSDHHVRTVSLQDLLTVLPEVIYHLESFDAWLVRSSIMNYLVAQLASNFVPEVFSGEGGDELFAGYKYLKTLKPESLANELIDIASRLHNTALQRVDRCAAAHGTTAHVAFLDTDVVEFALQIPAKYKLYNGIEKWILRQATTDILPDSVAKRPKAKFWQGAGVENHLADYADQKISSADFSQERRLPNGWILNSKEELMYYRIFREFFGEFDNLEWMGRTKGSPVT